MTTKKLWQFLTAVVSFLTLLVTIVSCNNDYENYQKLVKHYLQVIEKGTYDAEHSVLPTNSESYKPQEDGINRFGTFDFIIVGSSPSGSVLAGRLSEIKNWNVLLLEAGKAPDEFSKIPGMTPALAGTPYNWNYITTKQKYACGGYENRQCSYQRGKIYGGTAAVGNDIYIRGNKADFDKLAEENDASWSFQNVLKYFVRAEKSQVDGDDGYRGKCGPLNIKYSYSTQSYDQKIAFVSAHEQVFEYPLSNIDYNGKSQIGVFQSQLNQDKYLRVNVAEEYIDVVKKYRPNLTVLEEALVLRVLTNKVNRAAYAVEFAWNRKLYVARASKEIILSAGAINTPQLLMLSGIGPASELASLGIPIVSNLPVGTNLFDQPTFPSMYIRTNMTVANLTQEQYVKFFLRDYDDLTIAANIQRISFYRSSYAEKDGPPDIMMSFIPSKCLNALESINRRKRDDIKEEVFKKLNSFTDMKIQVRLLKPESSGELILQSKSPYRFPTISLDLLSAERDRNIVYEGVEMIKQMVDSEAMKKLDARLIYGDFEDCKGIVKGTKDYWMCVIDLKTYPSGSAVGTCPMGSNPAKSVVNGRLQVHGVPRLRVADAGIFPRHLSGDNVAPCVMLGEKLADELKQEYGQPTHDDSRCDLNQRR